MDETNIAILPNPGTGHLIPLAEFVRRLLLLNPSLSVTFILIPDSSSDASTIPTVLSSLPATAVDFITLPPPSFPKFSDFQSEMFTRVLRSVNCSLPALRKTLKEMTTKRHVSALVVDIFASDAIDAASELGIKSYIFYSSSAIALSMFLHFPKLDETASSDEFELNEPLNFPGCATVHVKDLPEPVQTRNSVYYKWFVDLTKGYASAEGIILNSFEALEGGPIRALIAPEAANPPIYAVGPLIRTGSENDRTEDISNQCLRWLDQQPAGSVLYASFGSGGTLSTNQVTELAWGLELSEQRFLWVVRSPNDSVAFGTYLSLDEENDPLGFLPKGFLERTKGRGLVVQSWAPQVDILSHGSTGGFLTHCGWNSILEAVVHGVGFIAWPLFGEQRMNAIELVDEAKVALRVEENDEGMIGRSQIAERVRALMEGEEGQEIQARMRRLKDEAGKLIFEKDGCSSVMLSDLAHKWKAQ